MKPFLNRLSEKYPSRYLYLYYRYGRDRLEQMRNNLDMATLPTLQNKDLWYVLGSGPSLNKYLHEAFTDANVVALTTSLFFPCRKDVVFYEQLDRRIYPNFANELENCLSKVSLRLEKKYLPDHFFLTNYKENWPNLKIPEELNARWLTEFPWLSQDPDTLRKDIEYFFRSKTFAKHSFRVRGSFSRAIFYAIQSGAKEINLLGFDGYDKRYFWHDPSHEKFYGSLVNAYNGDFHDVIDLPHRTTQTQLGGMNLEAFLDLVRIEFPNLKVNRIV